MRNQRRDRVEYVADGGVMARLVQKGMPEVGWEGDPLLQVAYNREKDRWELWDTAFTPPMLILGRKYDSRMSPIDLGRTLCAKLREMRANVEEGAALAERLKAYNEAVERREQDDARAERDELLERVVWEASRG